MDNRIMIAVTFPAGDNAPGHVIIETLNSTDGAMWVSTGLKKLEYLSREMLAPVAISEIKNCARKWGGLEK